MSKGTLNSSFRNKDRNANDSRRGGEARKHATLNDVLEPDLVLRLKGRRFVKASLVVVASGGDAIEDDPVEVEVRVEGRAEAVREAHSAGRRIGGSMGTAATEGRAGRAQEDPDDSTCDVRVVMQEAK